MMWKNKLNLVTPPWTLLLRRRGGARNPISSSTSCIASKQSSAIRMFSSLSYLPPSEVGKNICSFHSVHFSSRALNRACGQRFSCFSSGSVSADELFHCWNCHSEHTGRTPFLVCETCASVQPVNDSVDYFQIFGLERRYMIENQNLEIKYKNWQKKLHPDLVHTKSQKEREYAAEQSARVTDAYRTLTDKLKRAIYILKLERVNVDDEETITDPELLDEIMEIRESVEEASEPQALNQIQAQMHEKVECWSESFANALQSGKYEEALASIRRMRYYKRASEEIIKKL